MTHICYRFEIYHSYLKHCHLPIKKIQVARGNSNYFMLKGFNVKDIYLFSVWLLYKLIFLLTWLFNTRSLNTLDNAEKIIKDWKLCKLCEFSLRGSHIKCHTLVRT